MYFDKFLFRSAFNLSTRRYFTQSRLSLPRSQASHSSRSFVTLIEKFWPQNEWFFEVSNIRLKNCRVPQKNADFYRMNVKLSLPPGVHCPKILRPSAPEALSVRSAVEEHCRPDSSFYQMLDPLTDSLFARFPRSRFVRLAFTPDVKNAYKVKGLQRTDYRAMIHNRQLWTSKEALPPNHSQVRSEWLLDIAESSEERPFALSLTTYDALPSGIDTSLPKSINHSGNRSLGAVHPAYFVHQKVARSAEKLLDSSPEAAALKVARLTFELADEQFISKRLRDVSVTMETARPRRHISAGVQHVVKSEIKYSRAQYEQFKRSTQDNVSSNKIHRAYLALGSNIGDRIGMIESACAEMGDRGIKVTRTSALYETKAMYLEKQDPFINGACEIETKLGPWELLDHVKAIEAKLGRHKTMENGPRTIDLDILMFDNEVMESERLTIPHKRMLEREFVLRPLCDLIPYTIPPTPNAAATFQDELERLPRSSDSLSPTTLLCPELPPINSQNPARPTHLMAILNLTPDSFSDGGLHSTSSPKSLLSILQSYVHQPNPVTILDIGGQSTRPHAPQTSPDDELSRILPTIKSIRSDPSFQKLAISVDTYRASVAATAIEAGADIVNDVSAGQMDPEMLPTIAKLGCTCILMHMRGTPETMNELTDYPDGIINGVGNELLARVREAEKAGIRRWRIMLDPGIGFAKTQAQNVELLRRFAELRDFEGLRGLPWVVGASRKGFIGKITGVADAKDRTWGTAATVAAAVQGGADVVRVHDVAEMGQVAKMADAIWRA